MVPGALPPTAVLARADADHGVLARATAAALTTRLGRRGFAVVPRPAGEPTDIEAALTTVDEASFALETERAAREAGRVRAALDAGEFGDFDQSTLLRVLLAVADTSRSVGDEATTDAAIDRVLQIDPTLELDAARYSPTLRERFEVRRATIVRGTGTIVLSGLPDGAEVRVDGAPVSVDATVVRTVAGIRVVRVVAPSYEPETVAIEVPPGGEARLVIAAAHTPRSLDSVAGELERPLDVEATALLASLGWASSLLDVAAAPGGVRFRWLAPGSEEALVRTLPANVTAEAAADALDQAARERDRQRRDARQAQHRRRVAAWVVSAVGVSAGATTAGVMLRPLPPTTWVARGTLGATP